MEIYNNKELGNKQEKKKKQKRIIKFQIYNNTQFHIYSISNEGAFSNMKLRVREREL